MKIKFGKDNVTFKISENELYALLSGTALDEDVHIGRNGIIFTINPALGAAEPRLRLAMDCWEAGFIFFPTHEQLKQLKEMGRNKNGIVCQCSGIEIAMQVDVKQDSRRRPKEEARETA